MSFSLKSTATAVALVCTLSMPCSALAQVSPDILNLLIVAAEKDNGANLDMVTGLAIAANPAAEKDIRALVVTLKENMTPPPQAAPEAAAPVVAEKVEPQTSAPVQTATAVAPAQETHGFFDVAGWDGEVELNILHSTGNTRQQTFGVGGKLQREADQFNHTLASFFTLNRNSGVKDKQKWGLSYKLDYDFGKKLYVTSFAGYENDQFGAFRERITTSLGLGYPFIENDEYSWKVEAGPSILFTKEEAGEGYNSSFNAFASSIFKWTINDRSDLSNTTNFYFGNKTVLESKSALKVKINGALSSKFSYDIRHDRDAPLGRDKTDTIARAGLLYDF